MVNRSVWEESSTSKKLIEAGYVWGVATRPKKKQSSGTDGIEEDKEMIPPEIYAALKNEEKGAAVLDDFTVSDENWPAFSLFMDCQTQWNFAAGMGGLVRIGMNYSQVRAVMQLNGIKKKKRMKLIRKLRLIERGAMAALCGSVSLDDISPPLVKM